MALAVRSLPIHLDPVDGEALDSWLEAICRQLGCTWGDFAEAVGLPPRHRGVQTPAWLTRLTETEATQLNAATGISIDALHLMTLARLDGTGLRFRSGSLTLDRSFPWSRCRFSRYCPRCLRENGGRWQLFWRSGWAFACVEHRCLLVDECPTCGHRLRGHVGRAELVPDGQRCRHPVAHATGRTPQRCGTELATAPTVHFGEGHPTITAQRSIAELIDSDAAAFGIYRRHGTAVVEALADIRAVAGRILAYATPGDWRRVLPADLSTAYSAIQQRRRTSAGTTGSKPGLAAPSHAVTAAAGITAALAILDVADIEAAGHAMRWLIASSRDQGWKVDHLTVASWGKGTTAMLTAAQLVACGPSEFPSTQLRYRIGTPMPTRPAHDKNRTTQLAAKIPALMWPAWALRLTPPRLTFQHTSAGLACAMLLVNSRVDFDEAVDLLGRHLNEHALSHVLQQLQSDACWNDIRRAVIDVADYLHTHECPINYQRRRALDYTAVLPEATWHDFRREAQVESSDQELRIARCHLYGLLIGNPVRCAPWFLDSADFSAAVAAYPGHLTPVAAAALQTAAHEFLHRAGIAEPLTWQPPLRLLDGLVLPGADPDTINIAALHHLIEHREPLSTVARQLNSSPDAVRYVLTQHPAISRQLSAPTTPALTGLAARLPPETLSAHYHQQRMTLRDIASRYHVDRKTVARLAHQYGIDTRQGRPREHEEIDRNWLYTEYIVHRRTLPELAAEKGMSTMNMSLWAQRHGIQRRPRGEASKAANLEAAKQGRQAPTILRPALSQIGGAARLKRFEMVLRYPTITAAAADLGLRQAVLTSQITRLEGELGGALVERAQRGRPMTLTKRGARVLRAWKAWKRTT
jgi:TniQ/Bacterial regulatory helix-turn-helix protein, lysR family